VATATNGFRFRFGTARAVLIALGIVFVAATGALGFGSGLATAFGILISHNMMFFKRQIKTQS
jgi:hypothetical protein